MTPFQKHHPPVGSRPGTLALPPNSPKPRLRVIHYTADDVTDKPVTDVAEVREFLARDGVTWLDVQGLGDETLLRAVAEIYALHALTLEDVVNVPQRPKTESHDDHELYISRMVRPGHDEDGAHRLEAEQVSIIFAERFVLTFQEQYGDVLDPVRDRIHKGLGPIRKSGGDYLAYALIDTIIDHYYPVMESLSEAVESMEDAVLERPSKRTLSRINDLKRDLLVLRRGIAPQRDAVNALIRGDSGFVTPPVQMYFRDCYDHCIQIVDVLDSYRELASGLLNTYLSSLGNRTNEVMKVLTIMASIFIPLTFMAGIYGMNFESMPELHVWWFYPLLWVLMLLVAGGMLVYFKRKGWIGEDKADD